MAGGKGGKKIKMAKMENKKHLQVTFFKRRTSLFNKANQLCTLCGAKVLLTVFSPSNKVYSFGHPSPETLIHHFLYEKPQPDPTIEAERNWDVHELNIKYAQLMGQLEVEKKRAVQIKEKTEAMKDQGLWCGEIDELDINQLMHLKASLEQLKRNVAEETVGRILAEGPSHPAVTTPFVAFDEPSSTGGFTCGAGSMGRGYDASTI